MKKICINCGKEFESFDKAKKGGRRGYGKRPSNCITCSKKCSRVYQWGLKKKNGRSL
jgi:hypothetical protein